MIAYFASDLLWATRIHAAAEDLGIAARPVRTLEMLEARLADSDVRALVVDLESPEIALGLIARFREHGATNAAQTPNRPLKILAFGPHVDTDSLRAARAAGADLVVTRGQFHGSLPAMLQGLVTQ